MTVTTKDKIEMACAALVSARTTRDLLQKTGCPQAFIERADALAMDVEEFADEMAGRPVMTAKARALKGPQGGNPKTTLDELQEARADLAEAQLACVELQEEKDALVMAAHNLAGLFRALHENHAEWADYRAVIDLCAKHGVRRHPIDRVWPLAPRMATALRAFVESMAGIDVLDSADVGRRMALLVPEARLILAAIEGGES